jgi:hypothetical protein
MAGRATLRGRGSQGGTRRYGQGVSTLSPRVVAFILFLAMTLIAAACGGDSDSGGTDSNSGSANSSSGDADAVVVDATSSSEALAAATEGVTGDDLPGSVATVEGLDACDVLPAATVASFLGDELVEPLSSGSGTDCTYTTASNSLTIARVLALDVGRVCVADGWQPLNIEGIPAALRPDLRLVVCLADSNLELQYVGPTEGIDVPGGLAQLATLAVAEL